MENHSHRRQERGAVAVEFALVLPILLTLVFGIIELGRLCNAQIVLSNAARKAARPMAITIAVSPGSCPTPESQVTSTMTGDLDLLTGNWFGWGPVSLTKIGAM
jgi:hypothetical protein